MYRCIAIFGVGAFLASGWPCAAATSYPMVMSVGPVAIQVGTTAELVVHSRYSMDGAYRVLVSGSGVTGQIVESQPKASPGQQSKDAPRKPAGNKGTKKPRKRTGVESLSVRFQAEKGALPGIRDVRIVSARGVSTVGQLVIVRDPVIVESGENNTPAQAQAITLPAVVCGTIERSEDRDYFKFPVAAGQSLTFYVRGMALENRIHDLQQHLDPIITLRSPTGMTLAASDNDISADPILCHRFDRAGEYTLEIRDVRFQGNRDWVYCVEINDRPFVRTVFPLAVTAGQDTTFQLAGDPLFPKISSDWKVPVQWEAGFHEVELPLKDGRTNPVRLFVTNLPVVSETSGDNDSPKTSQTVSIPVGICGRLEKEDDSDSYSFQAKKGELLQFEVIARRGGSPTDAALRVRDGKGRVLIEGDDQTDFGRTSADAIIESWRAPADGTYTIEIRGLLGRGGPECVYFLEMLRPQPGFQLYLDTDKTELAPGTSGVIFVNCVRKNGFDGEITLSIAGLPEGVTAFCDRIPPGHRDGCIILTAAPRIKMSDSNITVTGTGRQKAGGKTINLQAVGRPLQETYLPGGGRGHWPVEAHAVAVSEPGDLRAVQLNKTEITLKPGESSRVDVTIERAPNFTDNVILSPRFDHLGRIYGDTLPNGVDVDTKHSKTLLTGKETRGFITFRAAPNAEPALKRPVAMMANVSINFVMKATYSSVPLFVTTLGKKAHNPQRK